MTHQNSLIFQNDIPAYRDASPDIRSQYDTIIESVDPGNPETVINFVAPALAELGSVATEIVEAHQNTSLQQEAMAAVEDLLVLLENVDPRSLRIELESATQKGVRFVKNNKIETAVAAGGLVTGNTTVTALAFLGIGLKKLWGNKPQQDAEQPSADPIEAIERRLRAGITQALPKIKKLQEAANDIPRQIENTNRIGRANISAYQGATLYLGSGRELLRRIQEEYLPDAQNTFQNDETFDNQSHIDRLKETASILERQLVILELGRNGVVTNTENLSRTKTYLGDIQLAVTSLLTAEAPLWLGDMAVGIQAANTHALAKTVELFQARVQAIRADTHTLIDATAKKIEQMRPDHPDAIEAKIKQTEVMIDRLTGIEMLQRTGQNLTTQAITARQTLENKTNELLALQVKTQTALNTSALQNPQHHTTFPGQDNN